MLNATAHWLSHPGNSGDERDLRKAFDSIDPKVAAAALLHQGAAPHDVSFLVRGWTGPRTVHIGSIASPLFPSRSVSQGDPTAPTAMA